VCGIAGEVVVGSGAPNGEALARMLNALRHRGPDGEGVFIKDGVALGHRRLTIIDLSDLSAQPMIDPDTGCAITYNGEIYNYLELRQELAALGHRFRTEGDTEVLLKAYVAWGKDCVRHLLGMFAFAIFDPRMHVLFAARDHAGQKPFIYCRHDKGLIFSSELTAMLRHPAVPGRLDPEAICHYLVYESFVDDQAVIAGVRRLPAGSSLIFQIDTGLLEIERYWRPAVGNGIGDLAEPGAGDAASVEKVLRASVERHLRSDVPVGIYLSGGIDSNLITTLACDVRVPSEIRTFTIRHTEPTFDEADDARWTADRLGTRHHEMTLTPERVLESVPKILATLDEPLADPGLVSIYQVASFASQHVKVVLSGDGGDEFFYGYEPFHKWRLSQKFAALPAWITQGALKALVDRMPAQYGYMGPFYKAQTFARGFGVPESLRNMAWLGAFSPEELFLLLRDAGDLTALARSKNDVANVYEPVMRVHNSAAGQDSLLRLALEYQTIYLAGCICAHTDKANMMHSLEARAPLLDPEVMALANSLPLHWKLRGGQGKWILRRYLERRLGPEVGRRAKRGFTVPIAQWLRGPLKRMAGDLLSPDAIRAGGHLNAGEVQRLWREHQDGRRNNYKKLWAILVLQAWQQRVLGL
jgi:asparagine synthase (glutamine-hydrolysing)